ncbi:MAG: OmpH family outer membrane protein [Desulfobacteraceae bacterium]|nr:OmpH family outer membrane protein [Desulfobacteraceae bacterium]
MQLIKAMIIAVTAFVLAMAAAPTGFCADVAKIGTVNFQKIFEKSTAGQAAKEKIQSEGQRMEQDLKQKGEEINALEKRLSQDSGTGVMSKDAHEDKRWELERKIDEVKALKKKYDRQIQELQMQEINQVRQNVLKLIQEYGKKEGYLLIVEDLTVVYAPQQLDITDVIIKQYNEQSKQSGKGAAPKG